jgi:hypothetical protein
VIPFLEYEVSKAGSELAALELGTCELEFSPRAVNSFELPC